MSARPWRGRLTALACLAVIALPAAAMPPPRLVGYVTPKADVASIEAGRMSAVILAFAHIRNGRITLDADSRGAIARLETLRTRHPGLKVLVSVGGWGAGGFSDAARSAMSRRRFAASAARLMRAQRADGLDIDWEYPGHHESGIKSRDRDRQHFTLLLQTVRKAFDRASCAHSRLPRHLLLTAALADGPFADHVNLPAVAKSLDWINLMTYDFNNSMTATTGHHAGLYASDAATSVTDRTTNRAVAQYLAAGVPRGKIVIGAAFYARIFHGVHAARKGRYQPYSGAVTSQPWAVLKKQFIDTHGFVRHWDAEARAPWLWNAKTRTFVTYDDPQSLRAKVRYLKRRHLGGIMFWEKSQDPRNTLFDVLASGLKSHPRPPAVSGTCPQTTSSS